MIFVTWNFSHRWKAKIRIHFLFANLIVWHINVQYNGNSNGNGNGNASQIRTTLCLWLYIVERNENHRKILIMVKSVSVSLNTIHGEEFSSLAAHFPFILILPGWRWHSTLAFACHRCCVTCTPWNEHFQIYHGLLRMAARCIVYSVCVCHDLRLRFAWHRFECHLSIQITS